MTSIPNQKQILRKQILGLRRTFTGPGKVKADRLIFQRITHHKLYKQAKTICTYVSMIDEADTHALIHEILTKKEKTLVVPKIEGGIINLYIINSSTDMEKGSHGILEPKNHCQTTNKNTIDLFLVPGVAFGRDGTRIGMGRGYYDRLLVGLTVPKMGLAYPFQIFDTVPATEDDQKVDILIS